MNTLGKAFVVAIMVFSLIFMSLAMAVYSTHQNWREVVQGADGRPGLRAELSTQQSENQKLRDEIEALKTSLASETQARTNDVAALESEYDRLKNEHQELVERYDALVQSRDTAVAAIEGAEKTLADLRTKFDSLRQAASQAQLEKDQQVQKVIDTTDTLLQAQATLERLEALNLQLGERTSRMKNVLERHALDEFEPTDDKPPKIDGVVMDVGSDGLIEISLGTDDGLRRGHTLEVYRANRYLGRVEVVRADPDRAVAKILPQFRQGYIQKEDRVASRLN